MRTNLRKCMLNDAEMLREMSIKTFYETFASENDPEDMKEYLKTSFDAEKLRRELSNENSEFYILFADEKPAGYLKLNEAPAQTEINDCSSLEIERIYVAREFQGAGLGRQLMEHAIATAAERGKEYVWLGVWEKNEKAIRFYGKNGFYRTGAHSFRIGNDEQTDYLMRRDLKV